MLSRKDLHGYQVCGVDFIHRRRKCALFLDMGLGKTAVALTAAADFLDNLLVSKVLVISPLRVANTVWKQEAEKWDHLKDLKIQICTGSQEERLEAFSKEADIYVINRENIPWMRKKVKWKFDMVIVDESSGFKNPSSVRFKALKSVRKVLVSTVILTGTPTPNGLIDIWSQIFLLDGGERLGRTITNFRKRFFEQNWNGHGYMLRDEEEGEKIKSLISDISISMATEDYLELPDRIDIYETVILPEKAENQYREFEKEFLLSLENDVDIEAGSSAVLSGKLLQMCNGAIYDEERNTHEIHDLKISAMKEIIADNPGENFLVAYNFKSDLVRIMKAFPEAKVLSKSGIEVEQWNRGEIKILLAHPASAGHGLNIQHGGSVIIWFGLNWSLELYQQFNKRLHRQGQLKPVRIIHIVTEGCLDEDVLEALKNKASTQKDLLDYLKYKAAV